jgi:hypothetical protein
MDEASGNLLSCGTVAGVVGYGQLDDIYVQDVGSRCCRFMFVSASVTRGKETGRAHCSSSRYHFDWVER